MSQDEEFPLPEGKKCGPYTCAISGNEQGTGCLFVLGSGGPPFIGYERKYCYSTFKEAEVALTEWGGNEHPPGLWLKVRGIYNGKPIDELGPGSL